VIGAAVVVAGVGVAGVAAGVDCVFWSPPPHAMSAMTLASAAYLLACITKTLRGFEV
jgi:hypothetical protein